MMRVEQAGTMRRQALRWHRAIGNPDAFMIEIHNPGFALAGGFLRTSAREKRSMEHGQLHFPSMIGHGGREDAGVLIVYVDEIDAVIWCEGSQPNPLPIERIPPTSPAQSAGLSAKAPCMSSHNAEAVLQT